MTASQTGPQASHFQASKVHNSWFLLQNSRGDTSIPAETSLEDPQCILRHRAAVVVQLEAAGFEISAYAKNIPRRVWGECGERCVVNSRRPSSSRLEGQSDAERCRNPSTHNHFSDVRGQGPRRFSHQQHTPTFMAELVSARLPPSSCLIKSVIIYL